MSCRKLSDVCNIQTWYMLIGEFVASTPARSGGKLWYGWLRKHSRTPQRLDVQVQGVQAGKQCARSSAREEFAGCMCVGSEFAAHMRPCHCAYMAKEHNHKWVDVMSCPLLANVVESILLLLNSRASSVPFIPVVTDRFGGLHELGHPTWREALCTDAITGNPGLQCHGCWVVFSVVSLHCMKQMTWVLASRALTEAALVCSA